jgi:predicted dehydrogenase
VSSNPSNDLSRRDALKVGSGVVAVSALAGVAVPAVHAAENNTIQVALIGCGGRGTGAAADAMRTASGPVKLVAMADVFDDKLQRCYRELNNQFAKQMDVPKERHFVDFDGYKKAMDFLKPGDVAILTTPPAFRWPQFQYAIAKKLNVFMEKPVTVDGPTSRRMLQLGEESVAKNLKVGVGLMCRHCIARQELHDRIKGGEIGDITLLRAYRVVGPTGSAFATKNTGKMSELLYQIRNFHAFLWASGGAFSDFLIHNIDECCWMKDAWPVEAKGFGGRHFREDYVDQNFDTYTVEYTFKDGTKLMLEGRCMTGCHQEFASYAHGTKGSAVISASAHSPARCRTYRGHVMEKENLIWSFGKREPSPYQLEWDHLMAAIRSDKPHNEVKRGVEASLVTSMGRMACHTGQIIKYEDMYDCKHEFAPGVDKLTMESPAPLALLRTGKYPVPEPGIKAEKEY